MLGCYHYHLLICMYYYIFYKFLVSEVSEQQTVMTIYMLYIILNDSGNIISINLKLNVIQSVSSLLLLYLNDDYNNTQRILYDIFP